jgi:hypothetical protein
MYCRQCGYNLEGTQTGKCPRCGKSFDVAPAPSQPTSFSSSADSPPRKSFVRKAGAVFLILLTLTVCYVAAYAVLVVPAADSDSSGQIAGSPDVQPPDDQSPDVQIQTAQPVYRFGGRPSWTIFQPVLVVDRWLFPRRWERRVRIERSNDEFFRRDERREDHRRH